MTKIAIRSLNTYPRAAAGERERCCSGSSGGDGGGGGVCLVSVTRCDHRKFRALFVLNRCLSVEICSRLVEKGGDVLREDERTRLLRRKVHSVPGRFNGSSFVRSRRRFLPSLFSLETAAENEKPEIGGWEGKLAWKAGLRLWQTEEHQFITSFFMLVTSLE